ncbi:SDR family NAD(P)-dependent oxidoreductase [Flavobacterium sp. W21_SRS_FM6]|uniref:SDR family NAD(P)-dependent oxidoreductase n=1 Tax=Flavobacterium sp. W21_SRS_FM6 TaxID=3240268 RepID=UPI003F936102
MTAIKNVENKHILITGGASGIGAATAILVASRGAKVVVSDRNTQQGEAVVKQICDAGGTATFIAADVSDVDSVAALFSHAKAIYGPVNVAINNAGIDHTPTPMHLVDDAVFHKNVAVNLAGVWYCMKQEIIQMLENGGGHVINIASVAGLHSAPTIAAYSATKHAVMGLTKSAAVEYAKANIRVNAVCPSFIRTPMVENVLSHVDERVRNAMIKANPMKRLGEVHEIAAALAWLCSDESSFMTGQSVVLDGGMLA